MMLNILLATTVRIEETESTGIKEFLDNFNEKGNADKRGSSCI